MLKCFLEGRPRVRGQVLQGLVALLLEGVEDAVDDLGPAGQGDAAETPVQPAMEGLGVWGRVRGFNDLAILDLPRQQVVLPDALGRALDDGGWILPGLKDLADNIVFGDEPAHLGFGKGQFGEEVGAKARTIKIIQAQDALALIFGQKLTSVESQVAAL